MKNYTLLSNIAMEINTMKNNHSTQEKLKNLDKARENPIVGKPNERDLLFIFRKVYISNNNTISIQEKNTLQHPKLSQKFMPQKMCQVRTIVWPAQKYAP
jgi:hypothetical protein